MVQPVRMKVKGSNVENGKGCGDFTLGHSPFWVMTQSVA